MAIGYYPRGCLQGGVELPTTGRTWQVMRLSRNRNWGHPELVKFLERFAPLAAEAIALRHLEDAKVKQKFRLEVWKGTDVEAKRASLEAEFEASMQAIVAEVIAIDAFYAAVQARIKLPHKIKAAWRANKTARYAQVCEVFRRAFSLKPQPTHVLSRNLRTLYSKRDQAVHPIGTIEAPVLHPELEVRVEWRFVEFRFVNADLAVREIVSMLFQLVTNGTPQNNSIRLYADTLRPRLEVLQASQLLTPVRQSPD